MEFKRVVSFLLLVTFMGFVSMSQAHQFQVGGKYGWVCNPSVDYIRWAERHRFQVNDTLLFKYKKGESVLAVSKEDYYSCNTKKPVIILTGGHSVFQFGHSGPFYFISNNVENCENGQFLFVVVLAVRHKWNSPPPMAAPPMWTPPPMAPPPMAAPPVWTPPPMAAPPMAAPPMWTPPTPKNQAPTMPPVAPTPKSWNPSAEAPKADATVKSHWEAPAPAPTGNGSGAVSVGLALSIACVVGVMSVVFW